MASASSSATSQSTFGGDEVNSSINHGVSPWAIVAGVAVLAFVAWLFLGRKK